jgi:hypothetical protein
MPTTITRLQVLDRAASRSCRSCRRTTCRRSRYPTFYSFIGKSGQDLKALNFGDHFAPALSPTQVIDNGQAGYSETGSWNTMVGGFNGTNRVARTVHSGQATATASGNFVDADGVLDISHGGGQPVPMSPTASASTSSATAIATLDTRAFSGKPTVTLSGVSSPTPVSVIYDSSTQPVVNQSSPTAVDTILGLGLSSQSGSNDVVTTLARALLSGNAKKKA